MWPFGLGLGGRYKFRVSGLKVAARFRAVQRVGIHILVHTHVYVCTYTTTHIRIVWYVRTYTTTHIRMRGKDPSVLAIHKHVHTHIYIHVRVCTYTTTHTRNRGKDPRILQLIYKSGLRTLRSDTHIYARMYVYFNSDTDKG